MIVLFVIYAMGDYAHAVALTTDRSTAEAELGRLLSKGISAYAEKVEVNDGITDLLND